MRSKATEFLALPLAEKFLLLEAACVLPMVGLSLAIVGYSRSRVLLTSACSMVRSSQREFPAERLIRSSVRWVRVASRYGLYRGNCLSQSMAMWCLLKRRGVECDLRIGGRKKIGEFEAHAWLECDGIVINDAAGVAQEFKPFEALIPERDSLRVFK